MHSFENMIPRSYLKILVHKCDVNILENTTAIGKTVHYCNFPGFPECISLFCINSLPNDKTAALSTLKAFADGKVQ